MVEAPARGPRGAVLRRVAAVAVAVVPGAIDVSVDPDRRGAPVAVVFPGDLAADDTLPQYSAVALWRGVRSVVSVGLPHPERCQGSVTAHCSGGPEVGARKHPALERFATSTAVVLGGAAALAEAEQRAVAPDVVEEAVSPSRGRSPSS